MAIISKTVGTPQTIRQFLASTDIVECTITTEKEGAHFPTTEGSEISILWEGDSYYVLIKDGKTYTIDTIDKYLPLKITVAS